MLKSAFQVRKLYKQFNIVNTLYVKLRYMHIIQYYILKKADLQQGGLVKCKNLNPNRCTTEHAIYLSENTFFVTKLL